MRGGMEAVYDDMRSQMGFAQCAAVHLARGVMFSARGRAKVAGQAEMTLWPEADPRQRRKECAFNRPLIAPFSTDNSCSRLH